MAFSPDDFYGGPNLYNPAMGLAMVQNPELIAAHLASLGHEPPADIPEGTDHVKAKQSLGRALAGDVIKLPQQQPPSDADRMRIQQQFDSLQPGPKYPANDNVMKRTSSLSNTGNALAFNMKQRNPFALGEEIMPQNALPYAGGDPVQAAASGDIPPPPTAAPPTPPTSTESPFGPPGWGVRALGGLFDSLTGPAGAGSNASMGSAMTASRGAPNPLAPPTPAPESSAATGPVPEGNTQATPGQDVPLPRDRPTSAPQGDMATTSGSGKKQPLDDLAMALSGLKGMPYSNPLHIYSPQAPRPSNMISRSTAPQVLMQEMAAAGRPTSTFRLGEALRGRSGE